MCPSSILIRSHLQHGPVTEGFCFIHGHSKMQVVLALEASFQLAHRVPELEFYRRVDEWNAAVLGSWQSGNTYRSLGYVFIVSSAGWDQFGMFHTLCT